MLNRRTYTKKGYGSSLADLIVLAKIFTVKPALLVLVIKKEITNKWDSFQEKITENHPMEFNKMY